MERKMRFHPSDVLGTAITYLLALVSMTTAETMVKFAIACCALIAGVITIYNGVLNGRKSRLEIRRLEQQLGGSDVKA